ncbi:MAG: beta-lactamase family protein [Rubrobacter sp.]|nr:beta-lactamase family protein [Rubrobacter sp.]
MIACGVFRMWLRGLSVAILMLLLLSGCAGETSGGGDTQAGSGDTAHLTDANIQTVNDLIAKEMEDKNLPGVVVGVWTPDEGEYVTAQGTANLDTGREREPEDPFRIASITKTFTGTAILQLVDEGKLSKSDPLSTWYPDFPNADEITVDDLLRMRSGMVDPYASDDFLQSYYDNPETNITPEDMIKAAMARADEFEPPDQKTEYNNLNFVLLGEIVGKVSGSDLGTRISQGIFEPLGMENSLYPTNDQLPGELHGYSLNSETNEFEDKTILNPGVPGAAGAIISDVTDMRNYGRALCTGDLLEPETQAARLETQQMDGEADFIKYGEGILQLGKFCGHNGTIFGFSSEMFYLPEEDTVILVNVNRLDVDDQSKSTDLFLAISKTFFPEYVDW